MERPNHCPDPLEVAINSILPFIHPLTFVLSVYKVPPWGHKQLPPIRRILIPGPSEPRKGAPKEPGAGRLPIQRFESTGGSRQLLHYLAGTGRITIKLGQFIS